jgi:hypothetical protein
MNGVQRHPLTVSVHDAEVGLRRSVALFGPRCAPSSLRHSSIYVIAEWAKAGDDCLAFGKSTSRPLVSLGLTRIVATLPIGTVALEPNTAGQRMIYWVWVERAVVDKLARLRGPGETFSHAIMRLAAAERG